MNDDPIPQEYREKLQRLAKSIDVYLNGVTVDPPKIGFCLFMFEFNKITDGRINYISNAERDDMMTAIKEYIAKTEGRTITTEAVQ